MYMYMYLLCSSLTYMKTVIWHTRRTRSSVSDHSGIFQIHLFNYITTPCRTHEQTCISCDDNTLLRRYFDKRTCIYYIVRLFVFIETPYMNIWDDQCDLMLYNKAMNNEIQIQDGHITVLFSIHVLKCLSNEKQILLIES